MTNNQKGLDFERKCYNKLIEVGFSNLRRTKNTDNGADIIGTYNGLTYVFQCKDHAKKHGNKGVQEVVAARHLYKANRCVVISSSGFTPSAIQLAKATNCILLTSSDFFEIHDFPPANYSLLFQEEVIVKDFDYDLVEEYHKIRKALRRTPKWAELDKHLRYKIRKEYKNYGNFLTKIGDTKYSTKPSDEELQKEYLRVKSIIKKIPTLKDIEEHSSFPLNPFHQYPFTTLQEECGDRPHIKRGATKEQLTDAYFALQKKLGHPPSIKEIDRDCQYRASYYRRLWGDMDAFFDSIGKTRTEAGLPRVYTKTDVILIYSLIKLLLSIVKESNDYKVNQTVLEQLTFKGKTLISPNIFSKKFGTWDNFVQYIHDKEIDSVFSKMLEQIKEQEGLFPQG